jgi:hypothetical protein
VFRQLLTWSIASLLGIGLVGCGPSGPQLAQVKGKVTYRGQPLAGATVNFLPEQGQLATGITDSSGEYKLNSGGTAGAVLGKCKVSISKFAKTEGSTENMTPEEYAKMTQAGKRPAAPKSEIPTKYNNPQTSGLEATVTSDSSKTVFDFTLSD